MEESTLDEFLIREGEPEGFDVATFIINDDDQALWAMRNVAKAQRRIDTVNRQAQEETERITRWAQYASKSSTTTLTYFTNALKSYMVRQRAEGRKSLTFPDGDVTSRVVHSKAAVADLGVFLKWAEETGHTQWVRIKKEADLSAIKDHVEFSGDVVTESETGEVIDGLIHVEGDVSVSIKISE